MFRNIVILGIAGACVAISCSPDTNDDDGEGGTSGSGGTTGGSSARGGTVGRGGSAGAAGSSAGRGGSAGTGGSTAGSAGMDSGGEGPAGGNPGGGEGGDEPGGSGPGPMGGMAGLSGNGGTSGLGGMGGLGGSDAGAGGSGGETPLIEAHYKFDEGTGTSAADSTGNFAPATLMEGAAFTPGRVGANALLLNNTAAGAIQHALLPPTLIADCDELTMAFWARLSADRPWARFFDADGVVNGFIFFTPSGFVGPQQRLLFNIFNTRAPVGMQDQGVSGPYPAGAVLVDQWHHYAVTVGGGVGRVYFDGLEIGSNPTMTFLPSDIDVGPVGNAKLGKSTIAADAYLNGAIDDLRVACRAYSAAEIAALVVP